MKEDNTRNEIVVCTILDVVLFQVKTEFEMRERVWVWVIYTNCPCSTAKLPPVSKPIMLCDKRLHIQWINNAEAPNVKIVIDSHFDF